jgi:hypothetical protein
MSEDEYLQERLCPTELAVVSGGGLNNVGIGFASISFSTGWDKSRWAAFTECTTKASVTCEQLTGQAEVSVSAFVQLLVGRHATPLQMEGARWLPILLFESRVSTRDEALGSTAVPAFVRPDCAMLPMEFWEGWVTSPRKM